MPQTKQHAKVLVVEDDESAAVFVTRVLDRAGYSSSWVSDADEASELLASTRFDVLLTDFRLPGRNGLELVQEARDAQPAIGIALMTSYNESGLERAAMSHGADDFFEKPLTPASLVSRIENLADRARIGSARSSDAGPWAHPVTTDRREDVVAGGESGELADRPPVFRRIGPTTPARPSTARPSTAGPRAISPVLLWASAVPVVSHVSSQAGPVSSPRTSAAWSFSD